MACRVLKVSRSGYYDPQPVFGGPPDWPGREPSPRALADAQLIEVIAPVHYDSRGPYGAPRVHAELRLGFGIKIDRKRVAD